MNEFTRTSPCAFEDTQKLAYAIYEERGREDGHELDHWLQAEARLRDVVNQPPAIVAAVESESNVEKREGRKRAVKTP